MAGSLNCSAAHALWNWNNQINGCIYPSLGELVERSAGLQAILPAAANDVTCSCGSSSQCRLGIYGFGENTNEKMLRCKVISRAAPILWNKLAVAKSHLYSTPPPPPPHTTPSLLPHYLTSWWSFIRGCAVYNWQKCVLSFGVTENLENTCRRVVIYQSEGKGTRVPTEDPHNPFESWYCSIEVKQPLPLNLDRRRPFTLWSW